MMMMMMMTTTCANIATFLFFQSMFLLLLLLLHGIDNDNTDNDRDIVFVRVVLVVANTMASVTVLKVMMPHFGVRRILPQRHMRITIMILMIMMILIPTRNQTRGHSTIERSSVFYSERATTWRVWSWSFVGLTCDANTPIRMGDTCCHNPKEGYTLPVMRVGPNPTSGPDTSVLCALCCVLRAALQWQGELRGMSVRSACRHEIHHPVCTSRDQSTSPQGTKMSYMYHGTW